MVNYESIYPGVQYTTNLPSYYTQPMSYRENIERLGMAVDPRTANQLGELNLKLNPGVKVIEIQGISPEILESIPEQHLDEMKRLAKLTGVKPTFHGPLIEPSGIGREGWKEETRFGTEQQMESAVLRAHKLDPEGNIPVTFHSTSELPPLEPHIMVTGKEGKREKIQQGLYIIDESKGEIGQIRPEKRYLEEGKFTGEEIEFGAKKELERRNKEVWTEGLSQSNRMADFGEDALKAVREKYPDIYSKGKIDLTLVDEKERDKIAEVQRAINHGQIYLRDSWRNLRNLFDRAWVGANQEEKKKLRKFAEDVTPRITKDFETDPKKIEDLRKAVDEGIRTLSEIEAPKIYKPLDEFVVEKSSQTFANVAEKAYNKYGLKAPIVSIENPPASSQGLSTAEELKKLITTSREKLAKNLVEHKGLSGSEAKNIAEKMIGATWDVGHINLLRKKGYTEKEIVEQTKIIAPYVKHVHLSDNFGLDHTELPMGMGNVPLKEMMGELKKAGFKGKEIIEAGNWWQYFADKGGGNPFRPTIEAFDSPIYAMSEGPRWSQTWYGSYFSGHGPVNPPVHHTIYGAGFQTLPVELGGEIPGGERGRFAGGGGE